MSMKYVICLCQLLALSFAIMEGSFIKPQRGVSNLTSSLIYIIQKMESNLRKVSILGDWDNMGILLKHIQIPVLINYNEEPMEGLEKRLNTDLVIIFNIGFEESNFLKNILWHEKTRFVFIYENEWDSNIFQKFWENKVLNVFVLVKELQDVSLYGFLPYRPGTCQLAKVILIDKWSDGSFAKNGWTRIRDGIQIRDMNHCPVNVTIIDLKPQIFFRDTCSCNATHTISGIEGNIMKEIAKMFNMEAMYVTALDGIGWGWIKPEPHGVVGEVYTGRSDFGMGLLAPTIERYENLALSVQYNGGECITYGVPKGAGAKQPTWIMILIFEFENIMWILIVFVFFIELIQFWAINKALNLSLFTHNFDIFTYLLSSCLGAQVKTRISATLRIAAISWMIYTFIITVAYKSSMGSKLTVPTPDPDINTFKDLLKSNLKLTGYKNMLRLIQYNDSDNDIKLMADRFVVTNFDIDVAVDAIAKKERIAHVRHSSTFLYYSLINAKANGHVHLLRDCIYWYYPMFVMKKNSPFEKRTNQIIMRLNEGGLVKFWMSQYMFQGRVYKGNTFEKLSLEHTLGVFFIILLGLGLSIVVFTSELTFYYFKKSKFLPFQRITTLVLSKIRRI